MHITMFFQRLYYANLQILLLKGMINMQNQETKLLSSLYKNASMGTSSINTILSKVKNPKLKGELIAQLKNYSTEATSLKKMITEKNGEPRDINLLTKTYADAGIMVSTMMNSTPSHIAEMMIQGTNMGVIEITKALNADKEVDPQLKQHAEDMLQKEQLYTNKLKTYL